LTDSDTDKHLNQKKTKQYQREPNFTMQFCGNPTTYNSTLVSRL